LSKHHGTAARILRAEERIATFDQDGSSGRATDVFPGMYCLPVGALVKEKPELKTLSR